jgi:hypothetical protein
MILEKRWETARNLPIKKIILDYLFAMIYLFAWLQHDARLRRFRLLALHTQESFLRVLPRPPMRFFLQPAKSGLFFFCGVGMNKALTIIQLAIVAGIIIYGTVCLYQGDFEGAYVTFPFLLFYYVWFVARKRRKTPEQTDEQ